MDLTAENLLTFAAERQDEQWATLARRVPFRYQVTTDGIEFVSENGGVHAALQAEVAAFCDEFDRERSYSPGRYPSPYGCPFKWYKSNLLALIHRFEQEQMVAPNPAS